MSAATTSVVVTAKRKLVELLRARSGLAGVQVEYAWPGEGKASREIIYLGGASGPVQIAGLRAGRKTRDEAPELLVLVKAEIPGGDQEQADVRVYALGAELEDLLAEDPSLAGALPKPGRAVITNVELDYAYGSDGHGRVSELTYSVLINARLT